MEETVKNSYVIEFKQYKYEVIAQLNQYKDLTNLNMILCVYGPYQSLKEFWYNKVDKTAYIFVNGFKIDVTKEI
jgi:hypothetical protein